MDKETGGPAFPIGATPEEWGNGMTLRDYFAGKAMQGMLANREPIKGGPETRSQYAYFMADAMLAERAK